MSSVVVEEAVETPEEAEQFSDIQSETPVGEEQQDKSAEEINEYELPKKFQGKSMEDIVGSYENLEKELGRKGSEIGELRKLTDGILKQQISTPQTEPETYAEETDFFDDPNAAVSKAIDNHPKFREFEEQQKAQHAQAITQKLQAEHPDFLDVVSDVKFQEWVQESPIRTKLYVSAHNYDYDSAKELIGNWKERSLITSTTKAEEAKGAKRSQALKAGKSVSRTSAESTAGKKIYRRADLIRLKTSDPERYVDLQDEILSAYADGRVK
tara:strand:+ start:110 stop:916 length:807 start_codon:yes stop_codon:yes gene_type:complete